MKLWKISKIVEKFDEIVENFHKVMEKFDGCGKFLMKL